MSEDFMLAMAAASHERVARAIELCPQRELQTRIAASPQPPGLLLSERGFDLIAEVKLRSPAAGQLRHASDDIGARVAAYADAGAAAISVLTEPSRFDGALAHVTQAAQGLAGRIPVMRKDFLVDAYQVYEARLAGAGGVLIILRMLTRDRIEALLETAAQLRLFALLEGFDAADLELAAELVRSHGQRAQLLVGVNCRDLVTLKVVPGRLEALAPLLPRSVPRVAESGVSNGEDAVRLVAAGYDVALVGSALMQSGDALRLAASMLAAGRAAASPRCG
jgi:indole-3-glycerol phosphate synthase